MVVWWVQQLKAWGAHVVGSSVTKQGGMSLIMVDSAKVAHTCVTIGIMVIVLVNSAWSAFINYHLAGNHVFVSRLPWLWEVVCYHYWRLVAFKGCLGLKGFSHLGFLFVWCFWRLWLVVVSWRLRNLRSKPYFWGALGQGLVWRG